jgi:Protein of unknown function (DUF1997)
MFKTFQATDSIAIAIPKQSISIDHSLAQYLQYPEHLVDALQAQSEIQILAQSKAKTLVSFRFGLEPLVFLQMRISPTVDLDAWSVNGGMLYLQSQSSKVKVELFGIEIPTVDFQLDLKGEIYCEADSLIGNASLSIRVEVPPPVSFTPEATLQSTGDHLVSNVLRSLKQRLLEQLLKNYLLWVEAQVNSISLPV